jgi:hypothetical protein
MESLTVIFRTCSGYQRDRREDTWLNVHHFAMKCLCFALGMWHIQNEMMRSFVLRRLLLILAILGVVMTPFGQAAAGPVAAAQSVMAMSGDMACCPDGLVKGNCKIDCPLVALCAAGLSSVAVINWSQVNFSPLVGAALPRRCSFALSSLAGEPPSRPPKL